MEFRLRKHAPIIILLILAALPVGASERVIVLNGNQLAENEIDLFDRLACREMADGEYWLDPATGLWGYEGDQTVRGRVTGPCEAPKVADNTPVAGSGHLLPD